MSLPEWVTIISLPLSVVSILLGIFAIYQSNEAAKRAETLNKQTQDALINISVCTGKIETIVKEQQDKQMAIIANSTGKLLDYAIKPKELYNATQNDISSQTESDL